MGKYISKIVILGDGGVGKTSLIKKFVHDEFSDDYISTIGGKISKKEINFGENQLKLQIMDIPGQDTFSKLNRNNFMGAKGAIVVYDCTRKSTFDRLEHWIGNLYDVVGQVPVMILGNKHDIIEHFQEDQGMQVAKNAPQEQFDAWIRENYSQVPDFYKKHPEFGEVTFDVATYFNLIKFAQSKKNKWEKEFPYYQTSASTGKCVEKAFDKLGKLILEDILNGQK